MAKAIMIQGTMSNVGKSFLSAALCRIFHQDGYRVAPFKSQNMALNSYVTSEGLEMGRAQVMQAEAAGIEPSVLMNPILLKPTANDGSQVVVNGEVFGNMKAFEYFKKKKEFFHQIINSYKRLESEFDIIVIEGAGSPVELNLKTDDIVNMGIAKAVKSPVLLVGDIDRGGIFAQLLGTLSLLDYDERNIVKGMIVNKFRGDRKLFDSGVKILEERGNIPTVGVVPYIDCILDDEDSLSDKLSHKDVGQIDIAAVKLPKISNFTDLDVFTQYKGVSVRHVTNPNEWGKPDLIIIPGTKSTIDDMKWLRESGNEAVIKQRLESGTPVFGICGGYQILGKKISDPTHVENGGTIEGMGILNAETVFGNKKKRTKVKGRIICGSGFFSVLEGAEFYGYEIHMGETLVSGQNFSVNDNGESDGAFTGNVCGSYVHGIFDSKEISGRIIKALCERKGISYSGAMIDRKEYKELQYNLLADTVRQNLDMNLIYKILREGV